MSVIKNIARSIAVLMIALTALSGCQADDGDEVAAAVSVATTPQQQLETIMAWWPGDYNNDSQLQSLETEGNPIWRADGSGEGGHIEVSSHYRQVLMPTFGENVLYVEETKHGDPKSIFRHRIYTISVDANGQVRVKLWYFNDKEKYVGAYEDLSMLEGLTPEEMFPVQDECDLLVSQQGDKYHMPMAAKSCIFGSNYFDYQVLLSEDSFWFRDQIKNVADDSLVEASGNFTYHELDRTN